MKNDAQQPAITENNVSLAYEVVKAHRKRLSRYKLKKQVSLVENILNDLQAMKI